jgi:hypothetical protein
VAGWEEASSLGAVTPRSPSEGPTSPVRKHWLIFLPVIEEVRGLNATPDYFQYLLRKNRFGCVNTIESISSPPRATGADEDNPPHACGVDDTV